MNGLIFLFFQALNYIIFIIVIIMLNMPLDLWVKKVIITSLAWVYFNNLIIIMILKCICCIKIIIKTVIDEVASKEDDDEEN